MNQTLKLTVLASLLAVSALAAGCVPSLNYGSIPPEPKYTTKVTTTTATGATTHPFTTPKPRTGTISWEELNGPQERSTRVRSTEATISTGYVVEFVTGEAARRRGIDDDTGEGAVQNTVQHDNPSIATEAVQQTNPPQTGAPQTDAPLQQVAGPPPQQEPVQQAPAEPAPAEPAPAEPAPGPPAAEQPDAFGE